MGSVEQISKAWELKQAGALSDSEFDQLKKSILGKRDEPAQSPSMSEMFSSMTSFFDTAVTKLQCSPCTPAKRMKSAVNGADFDRAADADAVHVELISCLQVLISLTCLVNARSLTSLAHMI